MKKTLIITLAMLLALPLVLADPQNITILSPQNGTHFTNGSIFINTTIEEGVVDTVRFNISNGTDPFLVFASNTSGIAWNASVDTASLAEAVHTITVIANDTDNNITQNVSTQVIYDITAPNVTIHTLNDTLTSDTTPDLNFTLIDNVDAIVNYTIYVDGVVNTQGFFDTSSAETGIVTLNTIAQGTHEITVEGEDATPNKQNATVFMTVDTTAPTSVIDSPANNTVTNDTTPEVRFTLTDDVDTTLNFTVYVDGTEDGTGGVANGTQTGFNLSTLTEGTHTVVVEARDDLNQSTNSTPVIVFVDLNAPTATIDSPANNSVTSDTTPEVRFTLTDNVDLALNFSVFVDGVLETTGEAPNGTSFGVNVSALSEGTHEVTVEARDDLNQSTNSTSVFTIVDTNSPTSTINSPANNTVTGDQTPEIRFTLTDNTDLTLNFTVYVDGTEDGTGGVANGTQTGFNLSTLTEGTHTVVVEARDDLNQSTNSTPVIVFVDLNAPNATIDSPANGTATSDTTPEVRFTLLDNVDIELNYTVFVDGSAVSSGAQANGTQLGLNLSTLAEGSHDVVVEARDDLNQSTNSTSVTLIIDTTVPNVFDPTPSGNFNVTNVVNVGVNVTDNTTVDTVSANITFPNSSNSVLTLSLIASTNTYNASFTIPNLQGQYNISYSANDSAGNVNTTITQNFNVSIADADGDGVPDSQDTLEGNETTVTTSGVSSLGILVGGSSPNGTFTEEQTVEFNDGGTVFMNFTHNFSSTQLDLSLMSVSVAANSLIVNLSGQLQAGETKTLWMTDNSFTALCVEDAEIASVSDISSGCDEANEYDFTACLGNSTGVNVSNIECVDEGSRLRFSNLTATGIRGTVPAPVVTSGGGGGGGGGYSLQQDITDELREDGLAEVTIYTNSNYVFVHEDERYVLRLGANTRLGGSLRITLLPLGTIDIAGSEDVDLDGDGTDDIRITVLHKSIAAASIRIAQLDETTPVTSFVRKVTEETAEEPPVTEPSTQTKEVTQRTESTEEKTLSEPLEPARTQSPYWWLALLLVAGALVGGAYYLYEHGTLELERLF